MKVRIIAQKDEKAQANIMKILDIQSLLPETACGHTKCISLLDHKAPKYVWYPGVLEASLLQGEVFCIASVP